MPLHGTLGGWFGRGRYCPKIASKILNTLKNLIFFKKAKIADKVLSILKNLIF